MNDPIKDEIEKVVPQVANVFQDEIDVLNQQNQILQSGVDQGQEETN